MESVSKEKATSSGKENPLKARKTAGAEERICTKIPSKEVQTSKTPVLNKEGKSLPTVA